MAVNKAVPTAVLTGLFFTALRIKFTKGSNKPVSIIKLKYNIAKINITPVNPIFFTPSCIIGPSSPPNPAKVAIKTGIKTKAVNGVIFFFIIKTMKIVIIKNPIIDSIILFFCSPIELISKSDKSVVVSI